MCLSHFEMCDEISTISRNLIYKLVKLADEMWPIIVWSHDMTDSRLILGGTSLPDDKKYPQWLFYFGNVSVIISFPFRTKPSKSAHRLFCSVSDRMAMDDFQTVSDGTVTETFQNRKNHCMILAQNMARIFYLGRFYGPFYFKF